LKQESDEGSARLDRRYRALLDLVLKHRWTTAFGAFGLLIVSLLLTPLIGREFLPPSDEGEVRVNADMEIGTRFDLVDEQMHKVEAIVDKTVPEMVASVARVGNSGGDVRISLTAAADRARSNVEVAEDLRQRLTGKIPGMEVRVRAPQGQFLLERLLGGDQGFDIEIRGFELETLNALAMRVMEEIRGVPGIADLDTSFDEGVPQEEIRVDRQKAAALGLNARDVTEVLRTAVAGARAGNFRTEGYSYPIRVQLANAVRLSLDEVLELTLATPTGELVSLRNLVETVSSRAPTEIERKDQQRYVTVDVNVAGRDLGSVARDVQVRMERIPRPNGYSIQLAGSFEEQQKAFHEMVIRRLPARRASRGSLPPHRGPGGRSPGPAGWLPTAGR
jgi:HAE1 family hydrophobic/amphiphilic exporter-1